MRNFRKCSMVIALILVGFFMQHCKDLGQSIQDVKDNAPGVCKTYCDNKYMCEWQEKEGPEAMNAMEKYTEQCILQCAYDCNKGAFAVDDQGQYMAKISGSDYQAYFECMYDYMLWVCEDKDYQLHNDIWTEQNLCQSWDMCLQELGMIGYISVSWDSDADVCENKGDWMISF